MYNLFFFSSSSLGFLKKNEMGYFFEEEDPQFFPLGKPGRGPFKGGKGGKQKNFVKGEDLGKRAQPKPPFKRGGVLGSRCSFFCVVAGGKRGVVMKTMLGFFLNQLGGKKKQKNIKKKS